MLDWIVSVISQYLEQFNRVQIKLFVEYFNLFNSMQKLNYWIYIAILWTIQLWANELLNRIICVK